MTRNGGVAVPRRAEETYPEVIELAHDAIRRRLLAADAAERARFREMALHERLDFVLTWLREYSKHFSMARVAQRIGVTRQAISKLRKGDAVPQRLLIPLADELGVDYRFLTDGIVDHPYRHMPEPIEDILGRDLAEWALADEPGRRAYVRAALELARAAELRNIDLRLFEHLLELEAREPGTSG
jgi:transcriptional regulator with XRE-family HTH domain